MRQRSAEAFLWRENVGGGGCDRSLCSKPSAGDTLNLVGTRRGVDNKLVVSQAVTPAKLGPGPLVFSRFPAIVAHRLFRWSNIVAAEFLLFSFWLMETHWRDDGNVFFFCRSRESFNS